MSKQARVLTADDKRPTRGGLHALLNEFPGVDWVGEARDGGEAVALVAKLDPDVVLMDVRMPVMDGLEATRRIKSQRPQTKVIVLSMYAEYEDDALAAGADQFLLKGVASSVLQQALLSA